MWKPKPGSFHDGKTNYANLLALNEKYKTSRPPIEELKKACLADGYPIDQVAKMKYLEVSTNLSILNDSKMKSILSKSAKKMKNNEDAKYDEDANNDEDAKNDEDANNDEDAINEENTFDVDEFNDDEEEEYEDSEPDDNEDYIID